MKKPESNNEIIEAVCKILSLENGNQLANHFGRNRRAVTQFRKGQGNTLTIQMLKAIIEKWPEQTSNEEVNGKRAKTP